MNKYILTILIIIIERSISTGQPIMSFNRDSIIAEFKNFSVVAMGEATHGAEEFTSLKCDLIKRIVTQKLSTTLFIEAPFFGGKVANEFIYGNTIPIDSVVNSLQFWTMKTTSFIELITWLKSYNATVPLNQKVTIIGMDYQSSNINKCSSLLLAKCNRDLSNSSTILLRTLANTNLFTNKDSIASWLFQLYSLQSTIEISHQELLPYYKALSNALYLSSKTSINYSNTRDSLMASVVIKNYTAEASGTLLIWAHNNHISKAKRGLYKPLGYWLTEKFDKKYMAMGTAFNEGEVLGYKAASTIFGVLIRAMFKPKKLYTFTTCKISSAPKKTFTYTLAKTGIDTAFLYNQQLKAYTYYYCFGSVYFRKHKAIQAINPSQEFDTILFVRRVSPLVLYTK